MTLNSLRFSGEFPRILSQRAPPGGRTQTQTHMCGKNPLCLTGNRYLGYVNVIYAHVSFRCCLFFFLIDIKNVKFCDFCNFQVFGGVCVQHAEQTESDRRVSPLYYDDWSAAVSLLFISRHVSVQQLSVWFHIVRWIVYSCR